LKNKISEDLEFEKNRMELLKKINPSIVEEKRESDYSESNESRKKAWEYELEEYKKRKSKEKFFVIGAFCGIISLIINLIINYNIIIKFFTNILTDFI